MFAKNVIFAFISFVGIFFILNIPKPNLSLTDYHNGGGINPLARLGIYHTVLSIPLLLDQHYISTSYKSTAKRICILS